MPATSTDRLDGLTTSVAVKAPVRSVSTANLTLAGEQSVNGVALVSGDRVLVKDQSIPSENGIYVVSTGSWVRSKDFDGNRDAVKGTLVVSNDGAGSIYYRVTTPNPITIGTTAINFEVVSGVLTQSIIGSLLYPQTAEESAASVIPADRAYSSSPTIDVRRYGYVVNADNNDNAVGNDAAIAAAIAVAREMGGASVLFPPGVGRILQPITLYDGVYLVGAGGEAAGRTISFIQYVGGQFVDVVSADASATQAYGLIRLGISGAEFAQQGTARYAFYAARFHRGCIIKDCIMRDCVGVLRIDEGYYGHVHHNQLGPVTPSQAASGASDAQWLEVYGANSAPVWFGVCNGSDLTHNRFTQIVGKESSGVAPTNAICVDGGSPVDCRYWIMESVGTENGGVTPTVVYGIKNTGIADFSGLYVEAAHVTGYLVYSYGDAVSTVDGALVYDASGHTCFYNDASGDMAVRGGKAYRMDFTRAWFNSAAALGAGGNVNFENVSWFSGARLSDPAVNADSGNVYDTAGTAAPLGSAEPGPGFVQGVHHRQFPRKITGLAVTAGADGSGAYVQVTCGTLLSEFGPYTHVKGRTITSPARMPVQRLRPVAASKWYRVWVGHHGGVYLVQHDTEPTDPTGDWIAEFQTDGAGAVTGLVDNPRLARRGIYVGTRAIVNTTSVVAPGVSKEFIAGDEWRTMTATFGEPIGWRFDGAVWRSLGTLS